MILTAAIYTKVFRALSHKITLVRFWARGWLTETSTVALKWSCQQFSDLFTAADEASSSSTWRQTMHRSANLNLYQLSCHKQLVLTHIHCNKKRSLDSGIHRHIPCQCAEPCLLQLPAKSNKSSFMLLGPRTVIFFFIWPASHQTYCPFPVERPTQEHQGDNSIHSFQSTLKTHCFHCRSQSHLILVLCS